MSDPFWDTAGPGDFGGNLDTADHVGTLLRELGLEAGEVVVEVGCGPGRLLVPIATERPATSFVGVEPSLTQLDVARERTAHLANVRVEPGTATALPLEAGSVDALYHMLLFQHFPPAQVEAALVETARVLRPGGRAAWQWVTFGDPPAERHHPHEPEWMRGAAEAAGLEPVWGMAQSDLPWQWLGVTR